MNGLLFCDDRSRLDDDSTPSPYDKVLHGCLRIDSSSDKNSKVDSDVNITDSNWCAAVAEKLYNWTGNGPQLMLQGPLCPHLALLVTRRDGSMSDHAPSCGWEYFTADNEH